MVKIYPFYRRVGGVIGAAIIRMGPFWGGTGEVPTQRHDITLPSFRTQHDVGQGQNASLANVRVSGDAFAMSQGQNVAFPSTRSTHNVAQGQGVVFPTARSQHDVTQGCRISQLSVVSIFEASGSWTCPSDVTSAVVECWGGAGIGGAGGAAGGGGGGKGGGYARGNTVAVTPATVYTVTVGLGGTAPGTPGGSSSFGTGPLVRAAGGNAGGGGGVGAGTGATTHVTTHIGDVTRNGGNGANGGSGVLTAGGGGGSGAGSDNAGNNASGTTGGAAASEDGGAGGNAGTAATNGAPGSLYGGAGAGGTALATGGAGARGRVKISYTITPP